MILDSGLLFWATLYNTLMHNNRLVFSRSSRESTYQHVINKLLIWSVFKSVFVFSRPTLCNFQLLFFSCVFFLFYTAYLLFYIASFCVATHHFCYRVRTELSEINVWIGFALLLDIIGRFWEACKNACESSTFSTPLFRVGHFVNSGVYAAKLVRV